MANNIKGITIEIGGDTTPLDKALKNVNSTSRNLQSELNQVNRQLKFDPSNTTLLEQKQKLLAESVVNTKNKLETLKEAERQVEEQFQKGKVDEEQYRALQREIIKTEDKLKTLEVQASRSSVSLSKISNSAEKVGSAASGVAGKMAPATLAIVGVGAAAVKSGSDLIESTNKVDVAFKGNAKQVEAWSNTTLDKFGIAKGSALEMASLFGDMGTSMGLTTGQAANMSTSLVGLAGDLASFKNIGIDQAEEALKGIFTGEGESLKTLGVVMTDTTLKEYAHAKGIKTSYDQMTQAEKVNLRYSYVMEKTKNAQGDFSNTSSSAANSMRIASEATKEAASSIGVMLAPIIAKVAQHITSLVKGFSSLSDGTKKVILVIMGLIAAIAPVAGLISGIATIVGAVTAVITTISGAIALYTGAATTAGIASTILAGAITFITSPVGIVIAIVTALVLIIKHLWDTNKDFRTAVISIWNGIKTTIGSVVDALVKFFTSTIPGAWNSVVSFFTGIPAWFTSLINKIKTNIQSSFNAIKTFFSTVWNGIKTTMITIITSIVTAINSKFGGVVTGIKTIFNGVKTFFTGYWNVLKTLFLGAILILTDLVTGRFDKLGSDIKLIFNKLISAFQTIWNGIKLIFTGEIQVIVSYVTGVFSTLSTVIQTIWNAISNFFVALWNGIKSTAVSAWNNLKETVVNIINSLADNIKYVWTSILNWFESLPGRLYSLGVSIINGLVNGIQSMVGSISSTIQNGFNDAINFITSLPSKALQWGKDFISNLVDGITGSIGDVGKAVEGVGDKIRSFLHHSVPDEGPLKDDDEWGGDFVQNLVDGINAKKNLLGNAVRNLASDIKLGMQITPAVATGIMPTSKDNSNYSSNTKNTINNINITSPVAQTPAQQRRDMEATLRKLAFTTS